MKEVRKIPLKEFKAIYSRVPRLCFEVVLKDNRGLLLIRRTIQPAMGKWHTPGGTVLKYEDLRQAVRRVAREEVGMKVDVGRMLGVIEYKSYRNHYSQDISVVFSVKGKRRATPVVDEHADSFSFFKSLPRNMIKEQKAFYSLHLNMPSD